MIALSAYKLANYLVDITQINSEDVKWSTVLLSEIVFTQQNNTRNKCYVSIDQKKSVHSYFFKQPRSFSLSNIYDFKCESEIYRLGRKKEEMKELLPEWIWFDEYNTILVTRYYHKATSLESCKSSIYSKIGKILAIFHQSFPLSSLTSTNWRAKFRVYKPSILNYTSDDLKSLKRKGIKFLPLVDFIRNQQKLFDSLSTNWDEGISGLIHGDLKNSNFIVFNERGKRKIKIIDFEFVCIGNREWDLAIFIASLLSNTTIPTTDNNGGTILDEISDYIRKFLNGYLHQINYTDDSIALQRRILQLAGVYFLQRFIFTEELINFINGKALILESEHCRDIIFKSE